MINLLNPHNEVKHQDTMPDVGERVLALFKGEWVVLEVGEERPTYEETFQPFKYWFEPFSEMLFIEYYDVTYWQPLPDLPKEQNND